MGSFNCSYFGQLNVGLICIYVLSIIMLMSNSLIAPLFPLEAKNKGMSTSTIGAVFSAHAIASLLMTAVSGKIIPLIGTRMSLVIGITLIGVLNAMFGFLSLIENYYIYMLLCFVIRVIFATGSSILMTTNYTLLIKLCKENLSRSVAINEACCSIGAAIGPPVATFLFMIGGYKLPFLVLGFSILFFIPLTLILLDNYKDVENKTEVMEGQVDNLSYLKLISMPKVVTICSVVATFGINLGVISSTLELYLNVFDVAPIFIGFMFMLLAATYTVVSLIISHFFKNFNAFRCFCGGQMVTVISFVIISRPPFYLFIGNQDSVGVALILLSVGNAIIFIPSLPILLKLIHDAGYAENVFNSSCVSAFWNLAYYLGTSIGPYVGTTLLQYTGSEIMFSSIALFNLFIAFVCFIIFSNLWYKTGKVDLHSTNDKNLSS